MFAAKNRDPGWFSLGFQAEVATGMSGDVWCVPATIQRRRPLMWKQPEEAHVVKDTFR